MTPATLALIEAGRRLADAEDGLSAALRLWNDGTICSVLLREAQENVRHMLAAYRAAEREWREQK